MPVVQPRLGAFPELVEATRGGLLYDPQKPGGLSDALEELLLNPERQRSLGETGKRAVAKTFSAQVMAEQMSRLFEETARKHD